MLDVSHVLATPGLDLQYFEGPGYNQGSSGFFISSLATGGVVTLAIGGNWYVGQAIVIGGTFTTGSITGYTSGAIYYIITVTSPTQVTLSASPNGAAVTSTASTGSPGVNALTLEPQWQTWRKPRGVKWVYMIGVGGGASGGTGLATGTTSGGGAGGSSGGQTIVMIPAMFIPDTLYIMAGSGGTAQTNNGVPGLPGTPTVVVIDSSAGIINPNVGLLWANPGPTGGVAATATAGGTASPQASVGSITLQMPLASKGFYNLIAGQAGQAGAASTAAAGSFTFPTSGSMVTAGTGGGGCNNTTAFAGGGFNIGTAPLGSDFFFANTVAQIPGSTGAVTTTPARNGTTGVKIRNYIFNIGGTGGGGATTTGGGTCGSGGNGAPGCGGGGTGGANTTNSQASSGAGGPGFVLIASW